ncbi:MAG: CopG family antitoxin [Thiohalospira sp.]
MRETGRFPGKEASEVEERAFWEEHDSSEFVDWTQAETVTLPNLTSRPRQGECPEEP